MNDDFEVTRGKGNVFRDFGYADADAQHLKAVLAAQIIKVLDVRKMTVRKAEDATGIAAADFSRIRTAKLESLYHRSSDGHSRSAQSKGGD